MFPVCVCVCAERNSNRTTIDIIDSISFIMDVSFYSKQNKKKILMITWRE